MRVAVLGGTRFIGVALIEDLLAHGHEPLVMHRGHNERPDQPVAPHVHVDRYERDTLAAELARFSPDAFVDTGAYTGDDAAAAIAALPTVTSIVALSSQDVYRAFHTLRSRGPALDALPLGEDAVLRSGDQRFMFRGEQPITGSAESTDAYENLDVEAAYLPIGAVVIRPAVVYGERDLVRREEPILRRVRAGRSRIPVGSGNLIWSRVYVRDVAQLVRRAIETGAGTGEVFNVSEHRSWTMQEWARRIVAAAGSQADLVRVPDDSLPPDLVLTGLFPQHVLTESSRARETFGWEETPQEEALQRSVSWHLSHPTDSDDDFTADDEALVAADRNSLPGADRSWDTREDR